MADVPGAGGSARPSVGYEKKTLAKDIIVLALLAGYWVFHCADGAMTLEFCAKVLTSVVLILLARPSLSGGLTLEVMPAVASAPRCRLYRPPELSRV